MENNLRKYRWMLRLLAWTKIPLIAFVRPKLLVLNANQCELRIPLRRRTKNHLASMYFGALCVGADIAGGFLVFYHADLLKRKVSFAFKSMSVDFLKRAETAVTFVCEEGKLIEDLMKIALESGERQNQVVEIKALNTQKEVVALFKMELSFKILQ